MLAVIRSIINRLCPSEEEQSRIISGKRREHKRLLRMLGPDHPDVIHQGKWLDRMDAVHRWGLGK